MVLELLGLQKIIDRLIARLFDDNWVAVWPFDDL